MKTATEYRADIKALSDQVTRIREVLQRENRDPSVDELATMTKSVDEIERIEKMMVVLERANGTLDRLAKPVSAPRTLEDTTATATRIDTTDSRGKDRFGSFREQLIAIRQAAAPSPVFDPRLNVRAASGLNETLPSDGGFLVQQDFATQLIQEVFATGKLASLCSRITASGNANSIKINGIDETSRVAGSRWGGIRAYWADEAEQKTASKPKFRKIELNLHKLIGLCYATDELLQDAGALESVIRSGFASEFGFQIDDTIINGLGVGQPLGIINAGCIVSVGKETGQAADTLVYENIVKMWSRIFADSRQNAVWLINQDCEPQLHTMSMTIGTGGVPVYLPASGASGTQYSTLFGRPVIPIEQCQTLGDTGDIYLADFKNGYILFDKGGMAADMSIHVRFIYDESTFRFVMRLDGQPVIASAVTPFKGSNTLSYFVKLDERA